MPVAMTDENSNKYYLHYDQVGSLRAISDSNQNIAKEITYDTYGNILSDTNSSLSVPFGFAGGLYDADTKLTRFGYRDYDAYTAKWTAKDPIGFSGGDSNLYGYVLGDPVGLVDPEGEFGWMIAGGLVGLGFEGWNQYNSGNFDWRRLVFATGTGALGGFGTSFTKSVLIGGATNVLNTGYQNLDNSPCEELSLIDSAIGGAGGAALGGALGKVGKTLLRNPLHGEVRKSFPPQVQGAILPNVPTYENAFSAAGAVIGGYIGN